MGDIDNIKSNRTKIILGIVLVIISLSMVFGFYFLHRPSRDRVNALLSRLPGSIGGYFESTAGEIGDEDKKSYLANHYISLEAPIAADKLYIIKQNNGRLYSELIKTMNSISSSKTEEIIMLVRDIENSSSSLARIYDAVMGGGGEGTSHEANRLQGQDILITINEIETRMKEDRAFRETLPSIMRNMNKDTLAKIIYYIDDSAREEILRSFEGAERTKIENSLLTKRAQNSRLVDLASLYEMKPVEMAVEEIGNTNEYSIEELGVIYANLSVLKAAEILSQLEDDSFIEDLYASIRTEEELNRTEDSITNHISQAMQFMIEYNSKIDNLVTVYGRMNANKAAEIVERMMDNNDTVTALVIDSEPIFEISDSSIIIDVLSRMKNKALSNIVNYMNTNKASALTQMLAEP
ncbi:MAG: hypothetical protein GX329_07250 [Tissierellia bacterium]|mgnify:CR=1 FL=1|nr:hypothetical protein [Tissierellia bacterium]